MSLNDLATSQPETEVSTSPEPEQAMVQQGEEAFTTPENVNGEEQAEGTEHQEEQTRTQKRINTLTGEKRNLEEQLLQERAAREAIERNMGNFRETKTEGERQLSDLDTTQLKDFISKARDNEDLEEYIPEAENLLIEKMVDDRVNKYQNQQDTKHSEEEGLQLTNLMLSNLSGNKLEDQDSQYFTDVQSNLLELDGDRFRNVNKDQLLATALAEISFLQKQQSGPSMTDRVVNNVNNNNKINANGSGSISTGGDLRSLLASSGGTLTRSKQGSTGSLRDVIKQLGAVKGLQRGG